MLDGLLDRTRRPSRRAEIEAALACPPRPMALDYLWRLFHRIRRRKGSSGFGLQPLEWSDLDAFQRLSGVRLAPWELEVVEELDDLFLVDYSGRQLGGE